MKLWLSLRFVVLALVTLKDVEMLLLMLTLVQMLTLVCCMKVAVAEGWGAMAMKLGEWKMPGEK